MEFYIVVLGIIFFLIVNILIDIYLCKKESIDRKYIQELLSEKVIDIVQISGIKEKMKKKYKKVDKLYMIFIYGGMTLFYLIIPIKLIIFYTNELNLLGWESFFSTKSILGSIIVTTFFYVVTIAAYLNNITNIDTISFLIKGRKLGSRIFKRTLYLFFFFAIYGVLSRKLFIGFILTFGNVNVIPMTIFFLLYLIIPTISLDIFNKLFKNKCNKIIKYISVLIHTWKVFSIVMLIILYLVGNTPKLSSTSLTLAIAAALAIYGFYGEILKYLIKIYNGNEEEE